MSLIADPYIKSVSFKLTACNIKITCLFIQWKKSQIHGTEASEGDSNTVENISIWEDSDVQIGGEDVVKGSNLLISEECIWHPHFAGICECQIFYFL